jgi:uncharacterized iron-regulated protein
MTIYISWAVHRDIKVLAANLGRSISEISEEALIDYLEKNKDKGRE